MPPPLCSKLALFTALLCAGFSLRVGMMQCIKPREINCTVPRCDFLLNVYLWIRRWPMHRSKRPSSHACFNALKCISRNGSYLSWLLLVLSCRPCKDLRCPAGFSPPVHRSHCFCSGHSGAWSSTLEGLVCPSLLCTCLWTEPKPTNHKSGVKMRRDEEWARKQKNTQNTGNVKLDAYYDSC